MPQKSSLRTRTWGTRFDTLPTSPPISPPSRAAPVNDTPPSDALNQSPTIKRKEDKMPHDASVFVGSLPSNIDQQELTVLLSVHLSEHTEIKNIKVVRDSKGGVCAFVQCEDATSATTLINTLHSNPPKQFLGRTLRYEPARAFRTLLISYRTPTQNVTVNHMDGNSKNQTIELTLPSAMRMWRPRNSKFYSLLYNNEAIDAENHVRNDLTTGAERPALFFQPVNFDAESICTLATYFGRLQTFSPFELPHGSVDSNSEDSEHSEHLVEDWKLYPAPHDAPRFTEMATKCWEIKWEHRDDCVSALMTLRRVPHLTVTWAHQPPPFGVEQRSPYTTFPHHNVAHYPLHIQNRSPFIGSRNASFNNSFDLSRRADNSMLMPQSSIMPSDISLTSDTDNEECASIKAEDSHRNQGIDALPVRWSDIDFPPLGNAMGLLKADSGVWNERGPSSSGRSRSASLTLSHRNQGAFTRGFPHGALPGDYGQELELPPTPGLGRSPFSPKTPGSAFPTTPTSINGAMQRLSLNDFDGKDNAYHGEPTSRERDIDPTTLFVGGLETFGPGAWDEDKVSKFFARFGGLENVKIVRPLNSHAAFAFVKFNNTESPARAVFEEHNRVYEGRAMRVQLRDCNPPRGSWRHPRGRGRFHQQSFGLNRPTPEDSCNILERSASHDGHNHDSVTSRDAMDERSDPAGESEPSVVEAILPKPIEELHEEVNEPQPSIEAPACSPGTPFTSLNIPASESYREWYDEPVSDPTPPPSSFASAASAPTPTPALPYTIPGGYYTPAPWVHPYGQSMQYPMPYVGYPAFPISGQHHVPPFSRPPGTDTTTPGSWPSMGMYGYIPYHTPSVRTPTLEAAPSQQHLNSRAPLAPTGFIQNEQGTLIAVYQPEALDQYMAGAQVAPPVPNLPSWPQYPPSAAYSITGHPQNAGTSPRTSLPSTNVTWVQNQGFTLQQHANPHVLQTPHVNNTAVRGGYSEGGAQVTSSPFRRHLTRRDQNNIQNNQGRNMHPRSFPNRNSRGNMNGGGYNGHDDPVLLRNVHPNQSSIDWNQWGSAGH